MKRKNIKSVLALTLAVALSASSIAATGTESSAASKKQVKSIVLKINKKKVTKKTYKLTKGKSATIKVTVKPSSAKKSVAFKSAKTKVATVTKKGKVTAKKVGTAKIKVTVTGKNKKKKSTWVKIKVTKASTTPTATTKPTTQPTATPVPAASTPKTISVDINSEDEVNPILPDTADGLNITYGGDPSVLVDGDTVYLYLGHDVSKSDGYSITEYLCYSSKDLKTWTNHGVVMNMLKDTDWGAPAQAWAGQVMKYKGKYYMYWCTQNPRVAAYKSAGNSYAVGVAVSDTPTGTFKDIGKPIVLGADTPNAVNGKEDHYDIDPTAWIETDKNGVEHRYLAWGNGRYFICELNEDMTSIKDLNGDSEITFGNDADIREPGVSGLSYTEAPWLYRRQDKDGKYYGDYYLFYAYGWREQMAYATTDDLLNGTFKRGGVIMEPTATSNTNHMAVFDFNGKTYFIYHNGQLPGGSGFRRVPCIAEVHFNEDGSIQYIPETTVGIFGKTTKIYASSAEEITHKHYNNSTADADYPYKDVKVGVNVDAEEEDGQWVFTQGRSNRTDTSYVSIQSENKPGLYITANDDKTITLAQNWENNTNWVTDNISNTYKRQTFRTYEGLNDSKGVSFESASQPGYYITLQNGVLKLTDGSDKAGATFYLNEKPAVSTVAGNAEIKNLSITGAEVTAKDSDFSVTVPYSTKTVTANVTLADEKGTIIVDDVEQPGNKSFTVALGSSTTSVYSILVYASNGQTFKKYTLTVNKNYDNYEFNANVVKAFTFENDTNGAKAFEKAATTGAQPVEKTGVTYAYSDNGADGKAITLDGTYGLKLMDDTSALGESYTISFWMNPSTLGGAVDPTLAGGVFSPEHWLNLTFDAKIWSQINGVKVATDAANVYAANEWQHVVVTVNGDKAGKVDNSVYGSLYVNGKEVASGNVAKGIMSQSGAALYFGVNAWDAYFSGSLDEVIVISGSVDERDVKELYEKNVKASSYVK